MNIDKINTIREYLDYVTEGGYDTFNYEFWYQSGLDFALKTKNWADGVENAQNFGMYDLMDGGECEEMHREACATWKSMTDEEKEVIGWYTAHQILTHLEGIFGNCTIGE